MSKKENRYHICGGVKMLKNEHAEKLFEQFKEAFPLSLSCGVTKELEIAMTYVVVNFHPDYRLCNIMKDSEVKDENS